MDPFSHIVITRKLVSTQPSIVMIGGIVPDIPFYLTYPTWMIKQRMVTAAIKTGNWPEPPQWMKTWHHAFHSFPLLLIGSMMFKWFTRQWPTKVLMAWGLHILVDIPTHSRKQWGPQFLFPFSRITVDGISWAEIAIRLYAQLRYSLNIGTRRIK